MKNDPNLEGDMDFHSYVAILDDKEQEKENGLLI